MSLNSTSSPDRNLSNGVSSPYWRGASRPIFQPIRDDPRSATPIMTRQKQNVVLLFQGTKLAEFFSKYQTEAQAMRDIKNTKIRISDISVLLWLVGRVFFVLSLQERFFRSDDALNPLHHDVDLILNVMGHCQHSPEITLDQLAERDEGSFDDAEWSA